MCGTCGSRTQIYLIANEKSILRNSPINKKGSFLGSLNYNLCYIFLLAPTIYSHLATISCRKHRKYNIKPIPFHIILFKLLYSQGAMIPCFNIESVMSYQLDDGSILLLTLYFTIWCYFFHGNTNVGNILFIS